MGSEAYPPRILLKIILSAYSKGLFSSRRIAEACQKNIVFMALCGCVQPDSTTLAHFISSMGNVIQSIFAQIIELCAEQKLIGGEFFAIDGCNLPSNALREYSGTFADLKNKKTKFAFRAKEFLNQHRKTDDRERKKNFAGLLEG